jgi:hypothetical protein
MVGIGWQSINFHKQYTEPRFGIAVLGIDPKVASAKNTSVDEVVQTVVAVKSKTISNNYNQLNLKFKPERLSKAEGLIFSLLQN